MHVSRRTSLALLVAACLAALPVATGCGWDSGTDRADTLDTSSALPRRRGAVLVDGCVLDTWQSATLHGAAARRVLDEVILLCLVPREDGEVGPRDPSARAALDGLSKELHDLGYRVSLAVAFTDESGQRYDGAQTAAFIASPAWRKRFQETLALAAAPADTVDLDLQFLPNAARVSVTTLVTELSASLRPGKQLGVFAPPSVTYPSDLPGGDAFAMQSIGPVVDRVRVMTLDYSELSPGPTIDPGWAIDAARLARASSSNVDVSYPLYAVDFGPRGRRWTSYLEARAISAIADLPIERGPTGAPFTTYTTALGELHEIWFDDVTSTTRALAAWSYDVLPEEIGVLYYGLGSEDPHLWQDLAARTP